MATIASSRRSPVSWLRRASSSARSSSASRLALAAASRCLVACDAARSFLCAALSLTSEVRDARAARLVSTASAARAMTATASSDVG